MGEQPRLTAATLIHHTVGDLLSQHKFGFVHFPEVVELAVVNTGLGTVQNSFSFVKQVGAYWDSTYWDAAPRPFLDSQSRAYANALAAWIRGEQDPIWARGLSADVKRPMFKSLKYLFKTNDSFFDPATSGRHLLTQSQREWLELAAQPSESRQIIAIRQFQIDEQLRGPQEKLLLEKLRSASRPLILHSISVIESLKLDTESVAHELNSLLENRDDEIRAKALIAIAKLGKLDEFAIGQAAKMVDDRVKHVVYAGVFALCTLESVPEQVMRATERGFFRALQNCDYEFVGLFVAAFNRWLGDPGAHFERLMQDEEPGYLEIALEALQNIREQSVVLD